MNNYKSFKKLSATFSNITRFKILSILRDGTELSVNQICKKTRYEQSRISHNLKQLKISDAVKVKRRGKTRIYSISPMTQHVINSIEDSKFIRGD